MAGYRILLHSQDPHAEERACVVRSAHGMVARCAAACGAVLTVETPHIHLLHSRDQYEGYCSEGCALKGVAYLQRSGRL